MIDRLQQHLRDIRCYHASNALEEVLQNSKANDDSYVDFLRKLLEREIHDRRQNRIKHQYRRARLPYEKLLECFDFNFQTSVSKRQVKNWLDFSWVDNRENKLLLGPSGVGKTHLAIGLAREALNKGYKVRYFSMSDLVDEMIMKEASDTWKAWLKELLKNDLIILDELGYLPINHRYTHLFFQLINNCYEYRSMVVTSNKMPNQWGSYFGDESAAMAILDRLMHHAEIIVMNGDSYRLKDKAETLYQASEKFSDGAFPLRSKAPSENSQV
jgi:DNA replication protein DnaC